VVLAAAALVVLVGAGSSLVSMYSSMGGGGYQVAWDRSAKLGLSQIHDGYQVRLEGAYADAAQTMLAISVIDAEGNRGSQVMIYGAQLTDEAGRDYVITSGAGSPADPSSSANVVWFDTPGDGALSGAHHFFLTVPDICVRRVTPVFSIAPDGLPTPDNVQAHDPWYGVAGPWQFEFDMTIAPATRLTPMATATAAGVTATLESMLISPTTVRLNMTYDGQPISGSPWTAIATILHDGKPLQNGYSTGGLGTEGEVITTGMGADNASGSWVLRIDELVSESPGGQTRLQGPWVIAVTAP
jgi:hypothetical protein